MMDDVSNQYKPEERISLHQHIVELKDLVDAILERAALEAYEGDLEKVEKRLLAANRAILEVLEMVRERRN